MSHLTRGAWIEIAAKTFNMCFILCRTSHEVRGLKYQSFVRIQKGAGSHLTRGAWIEIELRMKLILINELSHLTRGAWIEIFVLKQLPIALLSRTSHEVRGLKFYSICCLLQTKFVAPHTRCVD